MGLKDEYVGKIRKGCLVRDDPGEADLLFLMEDSKAQRALDGALDDCAGNARGPIAPREVIVDGGDVHALFVRGDLVITVSRLHLIFWVTFEVTESNVVSIQILDSKFPASV